jgi:peptidylprolyl isomerase
VNHRYIAFILLGAGLLAACGGGHSAAKPPTPAAAPSYRFLPAISHATDLHVEPGIGAGSPPPPKSLVTRDLVVGRGASAAASSTVVVQYVGADYTTGKDFDSSWQRGQEATFPLSGVVRGFAQGIVGMKAGGRREIVIPPSLGYGATGSPPAVAPNETLVFVVDLLSVK